MRDGDVVVFALGALLGKVGGEGRVPMADIFRCVEDSVTKVARSAFLHMGVRPGKRQLSGFICRWRQAGIYRAHAHPVYPGGQLRAEDHGARW